MYPVLLPVIAMSSSAIRSSMLSSPDSSMISVRRSSPYLSRTSFSSSTMICISRRSLARIARSRSIVCSRSASSSRDRKSTRLNSSHLVISYAVFCLKKKHVTIDAPNIAVYTFEDTITNDVNVTHGVLEDTVPAGWDVEEGGYAVVPDEVVSHDERSR